MSRRKPTGPPATGVGPPGTTDVTQALSDGFICVSLLFFSEQMQRGSKAAGSLTRLGAKSCSANDHKSSSRLFFLCKVSLISWTGPVGARVQHLMLSRPAETKRPAVTSPSISLAARRERLFFPPFAPDILHFHVFRWSHIWLFQGSAALSPLPTRVSALLSSN